MTNDNIVAYAMKLYEGHNTDSLMIKVINELQNNGLITELCFDETHGYEMYLRNRGLAALAAWLGLRNVQRFIAPYGLATDSWPFINGQLQVLSLAIEGTARNGAMLLAKSLQGNRTLKDLRILVPLDAVVHCNHGISPMFVTTLCESLLSSSVTSLDLENIPMDQGGGRALSRLFNRSTGPLTTLSIKNCASPLSTVEDELLEAISRSRLSSFTYDFDGITRIGLESLCKLIGLPSLFSICISMRGFTFQHLHHVLRAFAQSRTLLTVNLQCPSLLKTQVNDFYDATSDFETIMATNRSIVYFEYVFYDGVGISPLTSYQMSHWTLDNRLRKNDQDFEIMLMNRLGPRTGPEAFVTAL